MDEPPNAPSQMVDPYRAVPCSPPALKAYVTQELTRDGIPVTEGNVIGYLLGLACGLMEEKEQLRKRAVGGF